jgi:hypothetical protein
LYLQGRSESHKMLAHAQNVAVAKYFEKKAENKGKYI